MNRMVASFLIWLPDPAPRVGRSPRCRSCVPVLDMRAGISSGPLPARAGEPDRVRERDCTRRQDRVADRAREREEPLQLARIEGCEGLRGKLVGALLDLAAPVAPVG